MTVTATQARSACSSLRSPALIVVVVVVVVVVVDADGDGDAGQIGLLVAAITNAAQE